MSMLQVEADEGRVVVGVAPDAAPPAAVATPRVSIVLPAKNEAKGLASFLPQLREAHPEAEILVVDDGSTDGTGEVARSHGARVVRHPYGMGNGAAVKAGVRAARGEVVVLMDADGQHQPRDVARLLAKVDEGYALVVGARDRQSQASAFRAFANALYNRFASYMVSRPVLDLTSGFRAARTDCMRQFLHLLPNGFSYPTTSTMAFFRAGMPVAYVPVHVQRRIGRSHIRVLRDGVRFLLIILKVGPLYSPLRVFLPAAALLGGLGLINYAWTFLAYGRFTNMSLLLFVSAMLVFLIGLVSEQITGLLYSGRGEGWADRDAGPPP